jgi:hypothetical protein
MATTAATQWQHPRLWGATSLLAMLLGCASPVPPAPEPAAAMPPSTAGAQPSLPPDTDPDPVRAFEQQQRVRAQAAMQAGRWNDAVWAWDVVLALAPADASAAAQRERAQAAGQALAADRVQRANLARARGESDSAVRLYLEALAADPQRADAANALRQIERNRAPRTSGRMPGRFPMRMAPAASSPAPR